MAKRLIKPFALLGYVGPPAIIVDLSAELPGISGDEPGSLMIDDDLTEIVNIGAAVATGTKIVAVQLEKAKYVAVGQGGGSKIFKIAAAAELLIGPRIVMGHAVTIEAASPVVTLVEEVETTELVNFRKNYVFAGKYYICYQIDGYWVLDNQASFLENF